MTRLRAFFFLVCCLKPDEPSDSRRSSLAEEIAGGGVRWEQVIEIASEYWMTLALYRELGEKRLLDLIPRDLLEYFELIHEKNGARNQSILEHASELAGRLNQIGVEPILLKGACHLASRLYPDPAVRIMDDIDILVPADRALECWRHLQSCGYGAAAERADVRVEDLPRQGWPELWLEGRAGVVEMHRLDEWNHMLSSPALYADSEPVLLGGGRARIPNATSRWIFTIAHSYVHHHVRLAPAAAFRDLYDATLLAREHREKIDWQRVNDMFEGAGQKQALLTSYMMWRRLFAQGPTCGFDPPRFARTHWNCCLLNVVKPGADQFLYGLIVNAGLLRTALSRTPEGQELRREFSTPSVLGRKLRVAFRLATGPPEIKWR